MVGYWFDQFLLPCMPGFGNQLPRRMLKKVITKASSGELWYPMFGLAAAPEMVMAVPKQTGPP